MSINRAEIQEKIDAINLILDGGVDSMSHADRSLGRNLPQLRKQRDYYQSLLNAGSGGRNVRVGRYNTAFQN